MESLRQRILIIDDDPKLGRLLVGFLQTQGFDVSIAPDGAEGLQMLKGDQWDLVVLDVMLPRIDGFGVLKQIRRHSAMPVLMLTGRGAEDDMVRGLETGADDYLPKTASSRELLARIKALLRRAAQSGAPDGGAAERDAPVTVNGLTLNPEVRSVQVDGREIGLTPVEFALLASLVRHRGRVRSREELMQAARERRFEVFDRSIDVHIASLRRKLGDDSRAARFIRTVRAAGYLFIDEVRDA